ncbi:MAG: hypothetical protein JXX14_10365 [Deltaproteobacteria bacterium]|nr:hypothetical protein [Deltaproteobacteria bacterium]
MTDRILGLCVDGYANSGMINGAVREVARAANLDISAQNFIDAQSQSTTLNWRGIAKGYSFENEYVNNQFLTAINSPPEEPRHMKIDFCSETKQCLEQAIDFLRQ